MEATLFYEISCELGEGVMWHERRKQLFWVDILEKKLHKIDLKTKAHREWLLPDHIGTIVPDADGNLILGLQGYVARFDPDSGELNKMLDIPEPSGNRSNDGKCDPAGRFWLGTMSMKQLPHQGNVYSIESGRKIKLKIPGTTIANGIVWTKDKRTMYFIDSSTNCIQQFDYDDATGNILYVKKAVDVPEELGTPDGMTIDEDDRLWVAHYGGSGVFHWDPMVGKLLGKVEVPVPRVTSCTFGGESLDVLFITTAQEGMSAAEREEYPLSGSLFAAKMNTRGFAPNIFNG